MLFAVGAGILVLLVVGYTLIRSQAASAQENRLRALADATNAFSSLAASPGVTTNITVSDSLSIRCDPNGGFVISLADTSRLADYALFIASPNVPLGEVVQVSSAPVGSVYRVGTLLYARAPQTTIFVGDNLPGFPFPTQPKSGDTISVALPNQNAVDFDVFPSQLQPMVGTIQFGIGSQANTRAYIGGELLAAAALSLNASQYDCTMERYGALLAFETELQHRRVLALRQTYAAQGSTCASIYDERAFNTIETILYKGSPAAPNALRSLREEPLQLNEAEAIAGALNEIQTLNEQLLRGDRCATIS